MSDETVIAWAAMVSAMAWPVTILVIILLLRSVILPAIAMGGIFRFKVKDLAEFSIEPSQGMRPPSTGVKSSEERFQLTSVVDETIQTTSDHLPLDYYFLNHISFFRKDKQANFRKRFGFDLDHYDIQVTVDSYYRDALVRIEYVEYVLHKTYPHPRQIRSNLDDKFLLKELANGEFVLMAKVFLKNWEAPVLLQRYITLARIDDPRLKSSGQSS